MIVDPVVGGVDVIAAARHNDADVVLVHVV